MMLDEEWLVWNTCVLTFDRLCRILTGNLQLLVTPLDMQVIPSTPPDYTYTVHG